MEMTRKSENGHPLGFLTFQPSPPRGLIAPETAGSPLIRVNDVGSAELLDAYN
jgi:hypothetical protein